MSNVKGKLAGGKWGSFPAQMLRVTAVVAMGYLWSHKPGMDLKMVLASCLPVLGEGGAGHFGALGKQETPCIPRLVKGEADV